MVSMDDPEQTLDQWLALRLADALSLPLESLPVPPGLDAVALAFLDLKGERQRRKIYAKLKNLLDNPDLPVPPALEQLATITDFPLFISLGFDNLLERAIDSVRFGGVPTTRSLAFAPDTPMVDIPKKLDARSPPHVFHLLGLAGATLEFAVTEEDHLELVYALQDKTERPPNLFDALRDKDLLFLRRKMGSDSN